ncbi:MmgE/PrpD family protein [Microbacterium sp. zg.Y625]|uniref:MmgE/PrpD family protein n=1 Tax=Microbacterium jiangjiandongii TaxID=3049071 RepID=UPI00214C832C|nr:MULTISPECIES: MmgE/PrpD family protein [unclassified Microbacterium]MCR2793270.1 MmgE/PrpD family protein [Microbacterium sp. zg.Y625]WIM25353.1 MmgE/PrpD family protein [Microbacterium sp. zg-Y625]
MSSATPTPPVAAPDPRASATRTIAAWASGADLPPELVHHGRRMIIDYLAAASAGSRTELSRTLREHFRAAEPGRAATVIGGPRLTATAAAYVNGAAAHGLELDDGYTPGSVHPGGCVVPAVLAVGEARGAGIDDVAAAAVVGVEVTTRIAEAGHPSVLRAGFHNTPAAGVFGATAAVGHLLRLSPEQMSGALGLAGSSAGGLREYHAHGSEVKRLHTGKAAREGVMCAELAAAGVFGPHTILEGKDGYFAAFARGEWKPDVLLDGLGSSWRALRTYVKPYPCCRHLHGAIDAARQLRVLVGDDRSRIERIRVGTFELAARLDRRDPTTVMQAQFSLPFAVSAALLHGTVDLRTFEPDRLGDPDVQALAQRVTVHLDEAAQSAYPRERAAEVEITLQGGAVVRARVHHPLGEPENPLSDADIEDKFRTLALPVLGAARVDEALEQAWRGDDLQALTSALSE